MRSTGTNTVGAGRGRGALRDLGFFEDHEVLPGEEVVGAEVGEAGGGHFEDGLFLGHFVEGFDGDGGVFGAVFEEVNAAAGAEGGDDGLHHFPGVGELVIGIDEEGGVDGVGGELDAVDGAEVGFDVGEAEFLFAFLEVVDHLLLDIDGDDLALGDEGGEFEGVVAGAGADVGDDGVGGELETGHGAAGGFLFLAVVAFEPVDGWVAHDVGDFAAEVELAGAVAAGGGGGVEGGGWGGGSGCFRCWGFRCWRFGSWSGSWGGGSGGGGVGWVLGGGLGEVAAAIRPEGGEEDEDEGAAGEDEGVALHGGRAQGCGVTVARPQSAPR